jgi:hypothetical protein
MGDLGASPRAVGAGGDHGRGHVFLARMPEDQACLDDDAVSAVADPDSGTRAVPVLDVGAGVAVMVLQEVQLPDRFGCERLQADVPVLSICLLGPLVAGLPGAR